MKFETKKEIREALVGRTIKRIAFRSDAEIRTVMLVLDDGSAVAIAATSYQALAIGSD